MRILHISHRDLRHPRAGGLEELIHEHSRRWVKNGHEVWVFSAGFPGGLREEQVDGVRFYRRGREEMFNFMAGPILRRANWLGADVVIEHLSKVACLIPLFVRDRVFLAHVPHLFGRAIFHEVNWLAGAYVYGMERLIPSVYRAFPVWALSPSTARELVGMRFPADGIEVIPGGVNPRYFSETPEPGRPPTVLYLGRLRRYKGLMDPLLKAWVMVLKKRPDARLDLVGKGPLANVIRAEISKPAFADSVAMHGYVDEPTKLRLLKNAWCLVYPSVKEGWGLPVIEAGAIGVPTVASDSAGLRDAIRDGETGLLVPHGDAGVLAENILRLVEDAALRLRLGAAAKSWSRNFDWDVIASRALEFILRTARAKRPHPLPSAAP